MLPDSVYADLDRRLAASDAARAARYPGEPAGRQPVHTVYVPADRVRPGLAAAWGAAALAAVDGVDLPAIAGLDPAVMPRVLAKLRTEPIEDLRVDAEDGYRGTDEDADVVAAARALASDAPAFVGIRARSLEPATRRRGVRTLDLFLGALSPRPGEVLVTLPKVTDADQVTAMVGLLTALEDAHGHRLGLEVQVETPQAVLGPDGRATAAALVHAAAGRCRGLHHGTYDYTAALGIAAADQAPDHPAAEHAKAVMQVAAAGTGARAVDGSLNRLPVGPDRDAAWRRHATLVTRALRAGFHQGWDLHPAQLPTRYLATYAFFRAGLPAALDRLATYLTATAEAGAAAEARRAAGAATGAGGGPAVLDEPATARALAGTLVRALDCGAADDAEVLGPLALDRPALDRLAGRA
ncbi:MAG TPA: aldolase [Mycobacteriales bacterium]